MNDRSTESVSVPMEIMCVNCGVKRKCTEVEIDGHKFRQCPTCQQLYATGRVNDRAFAIPIYDK